MQTIDLTEILKTEQGTDLNGQEQYALYDSELGETIKNEEGELETITIDTGKPTKVKDLLITSLLAMDPEDKDGAEKYKKYELFFKIREEEEIDLEAEEVVMLKNLVAKYYSPLIVGQIWDILEAKQRRIE